MKNLKLFLYIVTVGVISGLLINNFIVQPSSSTLKLDPLDLALGAGSLLIGVNLFIKSYLSSH